MMMMIAIIIILIIRSSSSSYFKDVFTFSKTTRPSSFFAHINHLYVHEMFVCMIYTLICEYALFVNEAH